VLRRIQEGRWWLSPLELDEALEWLEAPAEIDAILDQARRTQHVGTQAIFAAKSDDSLEAYARRNHWTYCHKPDRAPAKPRVSPPLAARVAAERARQEAEAAQRQRQLAEKSRRREYAPSAATLLSDEQHEIARAYWHEIDRSFDAEDLLLVRMTASIYIDLARGPARFQVMHAYLVPKTLGERFLREGLARFVYADDVFPSPTFKRLFNLR
jgi:hypothetical protein